MGKHEIRGVPGNRASESPPLKEAFSIDDAVQASDTCRTRIYEEIREGRLIARKNGKRTIILRADFLHWLNSLPRIAPRDSNGA